MLSSDTIGFSPERNSGNRDDAQMAIDDVRDRAEIASQEADRKGRRTGMLAVIAKISSALETAGDMLPPQHPITAILNQALILAETEIEQLRQKPEE